MLAPSRPGYVYVMANPSLPGWHKVGHTHRPPHRRARELSRTALPTAFDVAFARFFWDAPAAERTIHRRLSAQAGPQARSKEFFLVQLEQAVETIRALEDAGRVPVGPAPGEEVPWEDTLEGREELWQWAEDDWASPDPARRRQGWRAMEQLSASGWAEGSWRLAEHIVRAEPGLTGGLRAAWVLDAAQAQGMDEAGFRAAWLRSFEGPQALAGWHAAVAQALGRYGPRPEDWPARLADTLYAEVGLWKRSPHRRAPGAWQAWGDRLLSSPQSFPWPR